MISVLHIIPVLVREWCQITRVRAPEISQPTNLLEIPFNFACRKVFQKKKSFCVCSIYLYINILKKAVPVLFELCAFHNKSQLPGSETHIKQEQRCKLIST